MNMMKELQRLNVIILEEDITHAIGHKLNRLGL